MTQAEKDMAALASKASMEPPWFTADDGDLLARREPVLLASMEPPWFTADDRVREHQELVARLASMEPPWFTADDLEAGAR